MADRRWNPGLGALEVGHCVVFAEVSIAAAGAPTLSSGKGVASVSRVAAGEYKITLEDQYNKLLFANCNVVDADDEDPNSVGVISRIKSTAVASSDPHIVVQFFDVTDGSAADPGDGAVVLCKIDLRNSTVD